MLTGTPELSHYDERLLFIIDLRLRPSADLVSMTRVDRQETAVDILSLFLGPELIVWTWYVRLELISKLNVIAVTELRVDQQGTANDVFV